MKRRKKLNDRVILFASIDRKEHDSLRQISYETRRSIADLAREAIKKYITKEPKK